MNNNDSCIDDIGTKIKNIAQIIGFIVLVYLIYRFYKNGLGRYYWKLIFPVAQLGYYISYLDGTHSPESEAAAKNCMLWLIPCYMLLFVSVMIGRKFFPDEPE